MKEISFGTDSNKTLKLFRKIDKFVDLSDEELINFVKYGKLCQYDPDELIIKEGDYDRWVHFLINGSLNILKGEQLIGVLNRCGDVFGEMGVIDGSSRSASIVAKSRVWLLGFDSSVMESKLKAKHANFCYVVYRIFAEVLAVRLRFTTEENMKLQKMQKITTEENKDLQDAQDAMAEDNVKMRQVMAEDNMKLRQLMTEDNTQLRKELRKAKNELNILKGTSTHNKTAGNDLSKGDHKNDKILIVDGVETTRKLIKSILINLGFKAIFEAYDGLHALNILEEKKIGLVFSEWDLPKLSGLDLLKEIRANPQIDETAFIMILPSSDKNMLDLASDSKVSQCLMKPYSANTVVEKIAAVLV